MSDPKSTFLYFTEGASDKVYNAQLEQDPDGWSVKFQFGRRGKPLKDNIKASGIPYDEAHDIYEKLVSSKTKKGYTEEVSGAVFSSSEFAGQVTGFRPQLLNEVTLEEALELDDTWLAQEKHDGERRGMKWDGQRAIYSNRSGLETGVQQPVDDAFSELAKIIGNSLELDGEDMGDHLVIFDVLQHPEISTGTFSERADILAALAKTIEDAGLEKILKVDIPMPLPEFISQRLGFLETGGAEGFVARKADSLNVPGKPSSGGEALKIKFWADCTCRVTEGRVGKSSVGIELLDEDSTWQPVGNVTVTAANRPRIGDLIDVKYLYAYEGGSLFQPSFKSVRTDIPETDCTFSQLKYKSAEPRDADNDIGDGPC
ncbi:WGR domain-containing protein [Pseudosulfitobacter pseudonitzschiae]|uniref:WGR domain-containing protein n=1 Tax=Pseudosulfitobacter pseudonitzschiae TaxID=1402135 RepID=UPI003B75E8DC